MPTGFDGIEVDLVGIDSGQLDVGAVSVTTDVTLWPRLGVIVANPDAWKALGRAAAEGDARRRRARHCRRRSRTCSALDDEVHDVICRRGATTFARASAADIAALRAAFAPVTARLDPVVTKEIARLRAEAGPAPAQPPCRPAQRARAGRGDAGRRRMGVHERRGRPAPGARRQGGGLTPENWGHYVFAFSRGRWAYHAGGDGGMHVGLRHVLGARRTA